MLDTLIRRIHGKIQKYRINLSYFLSHRFVSFNTTLIMDTSSTFFLGDSSKIYPFGKILILKRSQVIVGVNCSIERFSEISLSDGAKLLIGDHTAIGSFSNIRVDESIVIGSNVFIAQFVTLVDGSYDFYSKEKMITKEEYITRPIIIGNNVWIGAGAIILPGVRIGDGVVIGAGSVVTKNIDDYSVVVGNPSKTICKRN